MEGIKDETKKIRTKKRKQSELHTSTKNVWIPGNGMGLLLDNGIPTGNIIEYGYNAPLDGVKKCQNSR